MIKLASFLWNHRFIFRNIENDSILVLKFAVEFAKIYLYENTI